MAQIYAFPVKNKLPKEIEKRLYEIAQDYLDALYTALVILCEEEYDDPMNYEDVLKLVSEAYVDGLNEAIERMDES